MPPLETSAASYALSNPVDGRCDGGSSGLRGFDFTEPPPLLFADSRRLRSCNNTESCRRARVRTIHSVLGQPADLAGITAEEIEVSMPALSGVSDARTLHLSDLLGRPVTAHDGQRLRKVKDVIIRLDLEPGHHPPVVGVVATVSRRDLFVDLGVVVDLAASSVTLSTARLDLRTFERREGEILLDEDLLGHRLIDLSAARLVRARDVELADSGGWALVGIDAAPRGRLARRFARSAAGDFRSWSEFEPLIGHRATVKIRAPFSRLRRMRPAQLADLVEDATRDESGEILDAVGDDKELEADVFEELEPDRQIHELRERSDADAADVLSHMRPDDAADLLTKLPQERRLPILQGLPSATQVKIRGLLGFHPSTAGGLMTPDVLALAPETLAESAIEQIRTSTNVPAEVLLNIYVVSDERLVGVLGLPALLQADPSAPLGLIAEEEPVRVLTDADMTEVAVRMTDFNLVTIPVVDADDRLLGVITVDDVLKAAVPDDWWDRVEDVEEASRPRRAPSRPPTE